MLNSFSLSFSSFYHWEVLSLALVFPVRKCLSFYNFVDTTIFHSTYMLLYMTVVCLCVTIHLVDIYGVMQNCWSFQKPIVVKVLLLIAINQWKNVLEILRLAEHSQVQYLKESRLFVMQFFLNKWNSFTVLES